MQESSVKILKQEGHNFLWIDGGLWMWDVPAERTIQKRIAYEAYGTVLVAGYGLGIVQEYLLQNKWVLSVRTVEINRRVVEVCEEEYGYIHGDITIRDFYEYYTDARYDCIIGDIWTDIVPESLEDYIKFKDKAERLLTEGGQILAWGKDYYEYLIRRTR